MPSKEERRRREIERKIVECVKESILYDSYTPKKANTYQQGTQVFMGRVAGGAADATQIFINNPGVLIPVP